MKTRLLRVAALGAVAMQQVVFMVQAQPVMTVNIIYPATNAIVHDSVYIAATVSSTFELQGVQAAVGGRMMDLAYGAAAYSNCFAGVCTPQPGWSGTLSLSGLPRGTNTLTLTATDHFSSTSQAQRNFRLEIPVSLAVNLPTQGTVARPGLHAEAWATNDPSGTTIYVYQTVADVYIGQTFAVATNTLSTNLAFGAFDGQPLLLRFEAVDSINQHTGILRQVYVQASTNLVEVDHVSDGSIADVQPDRILFVRAPNGSFPPGSETQYLLKSKSRADGVETLLNTLYVNIGPAFLAPTGAVYVGTGFLSNQCSFGAVVDLWRPSGDTQIARQCAGYLLSAKGQFAAWGNGDAFGYFSSVSWLDLNTSANGLITNFTDGSEITYDVASNGDVAFAPSGVFYQGNRKSAGVYRFRNGQITLLSSDPSNTVAAVKTDGANVYYIKGATNSNALMMISDAGETKLSEGISIGTDYQVNHGWIAFGRNATGARQVWRRSPQGSFAQLTFFGSDSTVAGLAPNGEVAFYNGTNLFLSRVGGQPIALATAYPNSGMTVFWQSDRWLVTLGRSLFQVSTGIPQIVSPAINAQNSFSFEVVASIGQVVVAQSSIDLQHWSDFATNVIVDGTRVRIEDPLQESLTQKYYRLRLQ